MSSRKKVYLKDYQSPPYAITHIHMTFDLFEDKAVVTTVNSVTKLSTEAAPLILSGKSLCLQSLTLDGQTVPYEITEQELRLQPTKDNFTLTVVTEVYPQSNTSLEGLYKSNGMFCTQCEAEGFRRITYSIDRPDNMSLYTTTIMAEKRLYPVMLSNGNKVDEKDLENGRHLITWEDPFYKPSYLFALVAGDLEVLESNFTTTSNRKVALQIFTEHGRKDQCHHAMSSLKKAMRWDEDTYGLIYDLDIFMIVAVDSFNAGAMENKGLNIFNSSLVMASPESASDSRYHAIESVIGHEYFHNWSGNRVTCRDWFQLSLKEGLTVYRDQEFSSTLNSRAVERINMVKELKNRQFPEDAGPNAHAVRPAYCYAVNNFYTATIYNKGAEVVRMIETLVSRSGFRKGLDLYFKRHDGQAVTTEDFVCAMEDANNIDLKLFRLWYSQAGTPHVAATSDYSAETQTLTLNFTQTCRETAETKNKKAFHIPVKFGLLGERGQPLSWGKGTTEEVFSLTKPTQSLTLTGVTEPPTPLAL